MSSVEKVFSTKTFIAFKFSIKNIFLLGFDHNFLVTPGKSDLFFILPVVQTGSPGYSFVFDTAVIVPKEGRYFYSFNKLWSYPIGL